MVDLVISVMIFISYDLTQTVNCPTRVPECGSQSPAPLDLFLFSDLSIYSIAAFTQVGNPDHVVVSVSVVFFLKLKKGCLAINVWSGIIFISLNSVFLRPLLNFVYVRFVNILYRIYQVEPTGNILHLK